MAVKKKKEKGERTEPDMRPYIPAIILLYILAAIIGWIIGEYIKVKPGVVDTNGIFQKRTVDNPVTLCGLRKEELPG